MKREQSFQKTNMYYFEFGAHKFLCSITQTMKLKLKTFIKYGILCIFSYILLVHSKAFSHMQ